MSEKSFKSVKSHKGAKTFTGAVAAETRHFAGLDDLPLAPALPSSISQMTDRELRERMAGDPDAQELPDEFWNNAHIVEPEGTEQITLRLPRRVVRHFRATGKGYQSRISAVLSSYVDTATKRKIG